MSKDGEPRTFSLPRGAEYEYPYGNPKKTIIRLPWGEKREYEQHLPHSTAASLAQLLCMEAEEDDFAQGTVVPLWVALRGKPTVATYLHVHEGLSFREIAAIMDLSRPTVSEYVRRVKKGEE